MPADLPDLIERRVEAAAMAIHDEMGSDYSWEEEKPAIRDFDRACAEKALAAADKAALAGAEGVATKLIEVADGDVRETARDMTFEPRDGQQWADLMEQAAATIQAQAAIVAAARDITIGAGLLGLLEDAGPAFNRTRDKLIFLRALLGAQEEV